MNGANTCIQPFSVFRQVCSMLLAPVLALKNGWRTYIRQEIALVGFAMASIYLTVLGFSGVTSAYFLTQVSPSPSLNSLKKLYYLF